ncbi:MAG TPA: protein kinase [Planctomycetota bacterium]|nr:protein kinase [Planctomycetota bacterium]
MGATARQDRPMFGPYELHEKLGAGGMGVVYRARHTQLNRTVALKMTLLGHLAGPDDIQRFLMEAAAVASLDHPNIVPVYEIGEQDGQHFFSMKLIEGSSLADRIPDLQKRPREIARLMILIARAIHHAHAHGLLHRDLKPVNILVDTTGEPFVTDFGLATRLEGDKKLTATGFTIGTPNYMSPEQALGDRKRLTTAVDVYGLGAVFYEMMTGKPPIDGRTPAEILSNVLEKDPDRPSRLNRAVDPDLEAICLKCLEKKPNERYRSAEALAADLELWLAGIPIHARRVTTFERIVKWTRRHRLLAALVGTAVAALGFIIVGGVIFNSRLNSELKRNEEVRRELEKTLTRQVAERLDSDFRRLAALPQGAAVLLSLRSDWSEPQLRDMMRELLASDPRLFGICTAFEPYLFEKAQRDYALYIHRSAKGPVYVQFSPDVYQPLYREWKWYTEPRDQMKSLWGDPYFDKGGGEIWMTTFSIPFQRGGKFAGILSVDVSIEEYSRVVRSWLGELEMGDEAYGFLVDQTGRIVMHPQMEMFRSEVPQLDRSNPRLEELAVRLKTESVGSLNGKDPRTKAPASFVFVRVPSSNWNFVAVIPHRAP